MNSEGNITTFLGGGGGGGERREGLPAVDQQLIHGGV